MRGQGLLLLGGLLANYAAATPSPKSLVLTSRDHVQDEYDYVIVGGGTAGLTVADRLTESGRCMSGSGLGGDGVRWRAGTDRAWLRFRSCY